MSRRGEPIHLCNTGDHQPFFYIGDTCPYCRAVAQLKAIAKLVEPGQGDHTIRKDHIREILFPKTEQKS